MLNPTLPVLSFNQDECTCSIFSTGSRQCVLMNGYNYPGLTNVTNHIEKLLHVNTNRSRKAAASVGRSVCGKQLVFIQIYHCSSLP